MLRLIAYTLALALLASAAAWLSAHPGRVTLLWLNWRIDTSVAFLLLFAAALVGAACSFALFVRSILSGPPFARRRTDYARGMNSITASLVALASGNVQTARRELTHARKYLGPAPLTLLLDAQLAKLEGNDAATARALEAMLSHKETRFLAARGLSEYHDRHARAETALPHAMQAFKLNPRHPGSARTLISLYAQLGRWQEAEGALRKASLTLPRAEKRRLRALVHALQAHRLLEEGHPAKALPFATLAQKTEPAFAPFAAMAVLAAQGSGQGALALKLLKTGWKHAPHPALADAFFALTQEYTPADALKAAQKTADSRPDHEQSMLLLARAALRSHAYDKARAALKAAIAQRETAAACHLMADLEKAQYQDAEAAARWSLRAAEAEADAQWRCTACARTAPAWRPHCPSCHTLDSLEWQRATLKLAV